MCGRRFEEVRGDGAGRQTDIDLDRSLLSEDADAIDEP